MEYLITTPLPVPRYSQNKTAKTSVSGRQLFGDFISTNVLLQHLGHTNLSILDLRHIIHQTTMTFSGVIMMQTVGS